MKFCFLILEYVPYQISMISEILNDKSNEILAFSVNNKFDIHKHISNRLKNHLIDEFAEFDIYKRIVNFNPDVVIVGGWAYKKYNKVSLKIRKQNKNIPVVATIDTQWQGTFKQFINVVVGKFYIRTLFSHFWVAGIRQYEYVKRLGYKNDKIIFDMLSCNYRVFNEVDISIKGKHYPKNFVFVGRFVTVKGLNYLLEAWKNIKDKKGWTLTLIGEGDKLDLNNNIENIIIKPFMDQIKLCAEFQNSGCFILPSTSESWGLVLHEAACAGLPIIATNVCGASTKFLINNYNGYSIASGNSDSIKSVMEKIINSSDEQLVSFSEKSRKLGNTLTPETSIANLISIINQ